MRTKQLFLTLALLCTMVQGAWAQANWEEVYAMTNTTSANWTALTEGSTTGKTIGTASATTYLHVTGNLTFSNSTLGGSGLTILGTVYLYVPQGVTITCAGADASGQTGAGAGIELAAGNALCLLGKGAVSATGGDAADGGDGLKGGDADWNSSNYWSGTGGTGGYGGGGAGAGIGTRGGDGGAGGAGAASVITKWVEWVNPGGYSGFAGQAGATAGAMGEVYRTNSFGSLIVTGGAAASQGGSAGGAGKSMLYDGTGYNYTAAGGGGGGAGGFGGAASNIGTGGPGGGGGGGGASGNLDWRAEPGYKVVKASGGKGGQNANGTWADAGAESIMNHNAIKTGQVNINTSGWEDDKYNYDRNVSEQAVGTGGSGGARGSASTSEWTITLNMKIPTQEEWDMVCQQTNTSQSQWCALLPGGRKGVTIGIAGTTTYYFATGDCSFTGVNAGSSGLTIKGTVYIYVPQGMTITCTGTHASGTTGAGAGIELSAGNALYLLGQGAVNATGGNAANGGNGANGRDASCDWEKIRWAWVGGDGHGGYGGGGAGAGIGTRGGDGGAGGSAAASEIYYSTWVENGVAGSAGGAGLTADAMGSLYVTEFFGSLTATGGAAGSKSGSAGSAGKSCLHISDNTRTSLPGGGGGGAGGFGGAASNIGTGGPGGGGGGGGAKGSHSWNTDNLVFLKIFASGGGGGQNADGSFAADGGTAGVSKANVENGLCATNKEDWVKTHEEIIPSSATPITIGGSGGAAGAVSLALWPTQGMGEENSPYLISNEYEWNTFANNVSLGHNYSGKYVKLANNISVMQKCGTVSGTKLEKAFSGTFDGDGHTITAAITDTGNQGTALFCYIKGATIKNLKVAGTITGYMHAAAIVGTSEGTGNVIEGCVATANVIGGIYIGGTYVGGTHIGGILGHGTTSDIAIRGCVFSGMMTGGGEPKGVLFGWGDNGGEKSVTNCLYLMADGQDTRGLDLVRMNSGTVSVTNCYKTTSVGTYGTQCIFTTSAPSQLGNLVRDYGVVKAYENALFWDGKYCIAPTTSTNAGTEGDPYIIANETDWASFAQWIKEKGDSFTGEYVQLTADITASTPAGISEAPFGGTFLGNGHTITANITDTSNQGTALFRYINGATIKDLTVGGTITGGMHAAAIVGFAQGTGNSIRNCVATANVSGSGSTHIGGILGHGTYSDIAISGCVFSGTMTGGATAKGAIVGWGESDGTKSVTDCLYLMADGQNTGGLDLVRMNKGTVTVTNSYKTTSAGSYGTLCVCTNDTPSSLGTLKQDYGMVKAYATGILYGGTYYMAPAILDGYGTFEIPYYIHSTYEWDSFARYVNSGSTYSGQYVQLAEDISVSTMVGTSEANSFQGTFNGDVHTLTVNYDTSEPGTAPFRYAKNAAVKNLRVAGTITTSAQSAGGIVGRSFGALSLMGCVSSVAVNSSVSGDGSHGGLVGTLNGSNNVVTIDGCVFDGSFATTNGTTNCGGFVGWPVFNKPTIKNSLMNPSIVAADMLANTFARWPEGYEPTITNCYYTKTVGDAQGTHCFSFTTPPANLGDLVQEYGMVKAYQNGILYDNVYYVAPASISLADNADNSTTINTADGFLANVTLSGRTLYKDGAWNTICLPFDVTIAGSPLEGAIAHPLSAASIEGTTLNLTFGGAVTELKAGTPYIIKWTSGDNIVSPVFNGVKIDETDRSYDNGVSGDGRVRFVGTYKYIAYAATDYSVLLMRGGNKLYYPGSGASLDSFCAYFKIGDDSQQASRLTAFNIDLGDTTTTLKEVKDGSPEELKSDAWYDLSGRKLDGKPTAKGVYVNNNRKVVIK